MFHLANSIKRDSQVSVQIDPVDMVPYFYKNQWTIFFDFHDFVFFILFTISEKNTNVGFQREKSKTRK